MTVFTSSGFLASQAMAALHCIGCRHGLSQTGNTRWGLEARHAADTISVRVVTESASCSKGLGNAGTKASQARDLQNWTAQQLTLPAVSFDMLTSFVDNAFSAAVDCAMM